MVQYAVSALRGALGQNFDSFVREKVVPIPGDVVQPQPGGLATLWAVSERETGIAFEVKAPA